MLESRTPKMGLSFVSKWNGWEACGDRFQARSELALIPNIIYMDAVLDGR